MAVVVEEPAESEYKDWESQSRFIAIAPGMGEVEVDDVEASCTGRFEGCCCPVCTREALEGALKDDRRPALDFLRMVGLELRLPCG